MVERDSQECTTIPISMCTMLSGRLYLLVGFLAGCATQRAQQFRIEADPADVRIATTAARAMLFDSDDLMFADLDVKNPKRNRVVFDARDGLLIAEFPNGKEFELRSDLELAVLASAVDDLTHDRTASGSVGRRSFLGAALLDLFLPAAGALYVGIGNPYQDSQLSSRPLLIELARRIGLDGYGAAMFVMAALGAQSQSPLYLGVGIGTFLLNRAYALIRDSLGVEARNRYSETGLPEPHRVPLQIIVEP